MYYMFMKKTVNLPLYDEFLEIFDNHKIQNWQAKHFWEKMGLNQRYRAKRCKRLMYAGLKVLLKCQYLEIDESKSKKNAFSYTETPRLNELRKRYKKEKLKDVFSMKELALLSQIREKENNIEFLNDLLADNESLEKYFINYKETLENDIKNIKSNIKLMDDIMNK